VQWLTLAQNRGYGRGNNFTDRVVIIIGREPNEAQLSLSKQRFLVQGSATAAQFAGWERRCGRMPKYHPDLLTRAKRHNDAATSGWQGGICRRQVIEFPRQRYIDGYLEDGLTAGGDIAH
jgi:hypothetical protein